MPDLPEWLKGSAPNANDLVFSHLLGQLGSAALLGFGVAAVYFLTQRRRRQEVAPFVATLVLLSVLIAMITLVIGNSVARAFSLAGALAIIRFRTVVDDTRDTAFVIFAVVVGMAVGANMLAVAVAGLPVVAAVAAVLSLWGRTGGDTPGRGTLTVRLAIGTDPEAALGTTLAKLTTGLRLVSAGSARGGAALDLTYQATRKPGTSAVVLIGDLNRIEGVQGVEWKENTAG